MLYFIEDEHVYRYMEIVMYIVLVVLLKLFVFIINEETHQNFFSQTSFFYKIINVSQYQ